MPKSGSRQKRRTRAQWTEILRHCDASGLSSRQFCRREGLALSSFQRWRGQIGRAVTPDFVELVPPSTSSTPSASWALELSLPNGVCLRLRG